MISLRSVAAAAATALVVLLAAPAHAADPSGNTQPSGLYNCDVNSSQVTSACLSGAISDFNRARANEGLGPINLPNNFAYLPVTYQFLVLANIDRVDRGLTPFVGLSKTLNAYALQGAQTNSDPPFPPWTGYGAGNWVGSVSSLWGEFEWMYDDGPGSTNMDCPSSGGGGCWGHRHNIIMNWPGPMVMGAAIANGGAATIVLGQDTHDVADQFTWASELSQFPNRPVPTVRVVSGTGIMTFSVYRCSQTTSVIQRYLGGGVWRSVAYRTTPGYVSNYATWRTSVRLPSGVYRVGAAPSSRFNTGWSPAIRVN